MGSFLKTIGWGLYCTSSWTWCIGMWLPLLLIDRWGWPGFWLFAIPNVLGCAAMGYVVGTRERSIRLVREHRGAMRWFSCITIAFQLFWISALAGDLGFITFMDDRTAMLVLPLVVVCLGGLIALLPLLGWLVTATLLFAWTMTSFGIVGTGFMERIDGHGSIPPIQLWGAAPIIILGFLLSPYLDLTFHRARQETPSTHAFAVFGVSFMAVLLFVTTYWHMNAPAPLGIVLLFWMLQVIFTVGAHVRELFATNIESPGRWGPVGVLLAVALLPIPAVWAVYATAGTGAAESWLLDDTYLRFLGFYGLAVPIWVLAFMWPRAAARTRRAGCVLAATLAVAFVFAEFGMVRTPTWWILPAVALVMLVPLTLARPVGHART